MSLLAAWFWPKVSDRKNAQFAITEAWVVAAALAVITATLATAEILRRATEGPALRRLSALLFLPESPSAKRQMPHPSGLWGCGV